jgi:hypothetical protein
MNRSFWVSIVGLTAGAFATALAACNPGYMNASELASKHQGPSDCEARCVELGMRMGALVLVSDTLPGCVCQPKPPPGEAPKPSPGQAPTPDASQQGASAATTSYVVVAAAAAAARANQTQQQRQQQQSYIPK